MISFIKKIFGLKSVDYKMLVENGATLLDVRSLDEFKAGSLPNAINLPLQDVVPSKLKIDKQKPIIIYCASGIRSAMAASILKAAGFVQVYNGGGMHQPKEKL